MNGAPAAAQTMDATSLLLLTIGISVVIAIVGGVIGFVTGQVVIAQSPGQSTVAAQLPRLRNLFWLAGSSFTLIVADTKKLQLPDNFAMFWPWLGYLAGAMIGVVAAVVWACAELDRSATAFNRSRSAERQLDRNALRMELLWNGKERYERKREEEEARIRALEDRESDDRRNELSELRRQANRLVVANIYATLQILQTTVLDENDKTSATLETIIATIRLYVIAYTNGRLAGDDKTVRVTLMGFVPADRGTPALRRARLFTNGMPDAYSGDLVLRVPPAVEGDRIVLPVAASKEHLLPGAPHAYVTQQPTVINIREKGFPRGGPPALRAEIADYFNRTYFTDIRSITSIAVIKGHDSIGVLNIETSLENLVGADREEAQAVVDRLQVPIALLSAFL